MRTLSPTKTKIAAAFSSAANTYDQAAFVEQQIGSRLLERLHECKIQPHKILDLGCATGYFANQLQTLFPQAQITGIDLSFDILKFARTKNIPNTNFICSDAEQLPFANQQFDLVWSNCSFTPGNDLKLLFSEIARVLKPNGLLLFATFGPGTLVELGLDEAWLDMHILGDILLRERFKDPVVDMEQLSINYSSLQTLVNDLQQSGSYQLDSSKICDSQNEFTASFETIYGIASGQKARAQFTQDGKTYIPLTSISFKPIKV